MFGKLSSSVSAFGTNVFGQLTALVKPPVAAPRAPIAPERLPQESVLDTLAALTANAKNPTESHAARFVETVPAVQMAPPNKKERAVFLYPDGNETELLGKHDSVGSMFFVADDENGDGTVTPMEFLSHEHPGTPEISSSDALLLAARAKKSPGQRIQHTIRGFAENGTPANLEVTIRFVDGNWEYDAIPLAASPASLRETALIQLQCATIEISFSPPYLLESFATLDAAAPSAARRQSLGDTIEKIRQYFIANDLPEASVSWRQANVIGNMIAAYAPTQGLIHATAKAFWIAFCANLPEERRTGPFWDGLINLLAATQLPIRPAPRQLTLKQELDRLAMTRVLPFSIDFTKDVDAQIMSYRANLWSEAAQKTNLGVMEPNDAALIFAFSSPDTAVDVLENAFVPPVPGESHVSKSKRQRVYRGVSLLAPYLNGTEPAWMTRALKVFNSATNEDKPENSFSAAWRLTELIPALTGEQRKTALETLSKICGKINLIETYSDKNQRSVLRIELLIQLTDALDEPDKSRILSDCARLLDDRLNTPPPSMASFAPQALGALACLARRQNAADRQPTLRRLSAMLSDLLQKKEFSVLDTLRRVADVYPLLPDADRASLTTLTAAILDADLNHPTNLHVGLLALEGLLATAPDFPQRAQKLEGIGAELMAKALQEDATQNRAEALKMAARFISELSGEARDKAVALLTTTLAKVSRSGDLLVTTSPTLLAFVPESARNEIINNWLSTIDGASQNTSNSALLWVAAKTLQELLPYMGTDNARWERFVTIAEHLAAVKAFDPTTEPLFSAMRGRVAQTLIAAVPYLPADLATNVQNRLESAQRDYAETSIALDNVTLGGIARIPQDSPQNAEILADAAILANALSQNTTGLRTTPELKISKNFDRSLVTAHRLLHNTIQALTVNRFVLVTGPSGIGKSEAARYVASELNWPANVFNCSRATTRQHVMQRVGITLNKESGTSRFTITDGPLADALLNGKLFILNEINLAQPGNLAFLFKILADMEDAFEYYNIRTGKVETRRIHPNFRMLATQNPDGPGRKDLNAALKNRAIEIFTPAYSDAELACLLETKAPELKARFGGDIYGTLVAFHFGISAKIKSRVIGSHDEGYVWNLRHLLRLAEGFAAHADATPDAASILQIFFDRVGVSLLPRDRQIFFDEIRRHVYGGVSISASDVENFKTSLTNIKMTDVYDAFSIPRQQGADAAAQFKISDIPTSARYLRSILASFNAGYHVWLKGPAGTGKTRLAQFAAGLTGTTFFSDTFTPQTDEAQLKGEFRPRILTSEDGAEKLGFEYVPAPLVLALRHAAKHRDQKTVCLLDEAAFAKPDVLEELNSLIDRDGGLWLLSEDGERIEFLECPDNFRLILASNTYGYSGVQLQSEALRSRTQEIFMDFEYSGSEIDTFMERFISPFAEISLDELPDVPPGELEPAQPAPAAPALSPNGGITTAIPPVVIPPPPGAPADPTDVPVPRAAFGGFGASGKPPLIRYAERFAGSVTTPKELNLTPGEQLKAAGIQLPDAIVALIDERFKDLSRRLLGEAVSSGRDPDISIVFDPKTKTASMSAEKPRTFKIGPHLLASKDVEDLLNVALHEGSHADISRTGTGFFFDDKIANALIGVVEDMRVNARAMERTPGRTASYRAMLKHDYSEQFDALKDGEFPNLLPHEGFLDALLAIEYGGDSVWLGDPVVGKALRDAAPSVAKAIAARPREANPSEESVRLHFARFETILKNEIFPIYEKLVALSREEIEKRQQKSGKDKKSDDNNGDNTIEGRAEKISEALGSPGASGKNGKGTGKGQKNATQAESAAAPGDEGKPAKPQNGSQAPEGKEDQPNPNDAADALKNMARARQKTANADKEWLQNNAYSDLMKDLSTLADRVFAVFDRLLKPNADPENDERFFSGNDLDIDKAVRITMGLTTDMRAFLRPSDPQARSYRFSLLLDASGSMNKDAARKRGGLGLAALFVDVFERLGLPYGIDAFHDKYIPLKDFGKNLKLAPKRNEFFNDVVKDVFGKGSTAIRLGMIGALDRIRKERKTNPRGTEFLFVLTDGEEEIKTGTPIREQCLQAAKEGIIVVGIGIGDGMGMARKHFPVNLVTDDPEQLPALIAEFIKRYAQSAIEE